MLISLKNDLERFRDELMPNEESVLHYIEFYRSLHIAIKEQRRAYIDFETKEKDFTINCEIKDAYITSKFENVDGISIILEYVERGEAESHYILLPPVTFGSLSTSDSKIDKYYIEGRDGTYRVQILGQ